MKDLVFQRVYQKHINSLVDISVKTFTDSFYKLNDQVFFKQYIDQAFHPDTLALELNDPASVFYFLTNNDEVVGYYKLNLYLDHLQQEDSSQAELQRIYVVSGHQGQGFGKIMLDHVRDYLSKLDSKVIWLGVWERNPGAIKFYQAHGFTKIGEHDFWMGADKQTDWILCKSI